MKKAAVGFRVHSGWSAAVAVCLEKGAPAVLRRERLQLVEEFTYRFRQLYHTAEKMALAEAQEFIAAVRAKASDLASRAIHGLQAELQEQGYQLHSGTLLLVSARALPELEKILASHALIHTADGELFREALTRASVRCGLEVVSVKERELAGEVTQSFGMTEAALLKRVTDLGRPLGSPWSQDEKYATLGAWLALADRKGRCACG